MSMYILQNYLKIFKNIFLGRSHMGTLGDKTSQWRLFKWLPGHVPYLPYPRYATDSSCLPCHHHGTPELGSCCSCMYILVPCCDVHYNFRVKTMFDLSLPPFVLNRNCMLMSYTNSISGDARVTRLL